MISLIVDPQIREWAMSITDEHNQLRKERDAWRAAVESMLRLLDQERGNWSGAACAAVEKCSIHIKDTITKHGLTFDKENL